MKAPLPGPGGRLASALRLWVKRSGQFRQTQQAHSLPSFYFTARTERRWHTAARTASITGKPKLHPQPRVWRSVALASLLVSSALAASTLAFPHDAHAEAPSASPSPSPSASASVSGPTPRKIRLAEVQAHGRDALRIWVIRGTRVYDITDWIPSHPGGEVILRAAGGSIDQYWDIFAVHKKQDVYDVLEQYCIGVVDPQDLANGLVPAANVDDPFGHDPPRDRRMQQLTDRPFTAEPPAALLADFVTPNELFFVRNHFWVPESPPSEHKLTIELPDGEEVVYSTEELQARFQPHTITAVLQCAGNRRSHMSANARSTNGLQWDVGAIGNAEWTGARLRDVLADAGLDVDELPETVRHAILMGSEAYGTSIPIEKAVDKRGDVLLAYAMNGEPLPRDHGYPLRVIVPGHVAARSVKWISKISLSDEESTTQWQRRDYKCFGPNEGSKPNWDIPPSIQETPVQSAITSMRDVTTADSKLLELYGMEEDCVALEGYAFSGGGRQIVRVDVSADDGRSWHQAKLLDGEGEEKAKGSKTWGWRRWSFCIPQSAVELGFVVKAVDESYNTQPDGYEPQYNYRGNLTTAWHRVPYNRAEE